jgi:hypothetical protein
MPTIPIRRVLLNALVVALLAPLLPACNKEKPTKVVIIVKTAEGATVADAYVRLFANPPLPLGDQTRLNKEGYTDGSGKATFDYSDFYEKGQSGFAVLDIYSSKDTLVGEGIIKILEEETNEETVFLSTQ